MRGVEYESSLRNKWHKSFRYLSHKFQTSATLVSDVCHECFRRLPRVFQTSETKRYDITSQSISFYGATCVICHTLL